jgi:predicted dehydrogenase
MNRSNRREFLKTASAASTAFGLFTIAGTKSSGRVLGANDVIRVGVAGINGRGGAHIGTFTKAKGAQVTHLIDPDSRLFAGRVADVRKRAGNTPKTIQDIRHALDDNELDAVTVATCNHWHALITIWACQAGKDVYVEKPLSHNVHEGRIAVAAARKHGRIVQHGTQNRSSGGVAREIAAAQSGKYGKLLVSKGYASKPRWSIGHKPIEAPPADMDFNIWLGPAPEQPYHHNLVHYNWHWFWDFGNGEIGNQGVHQMDIARWAIAGGTLPASVISLGGRFGYEDQGQTPNTQMAVFDYGDTKLVFEVCGLVEGKSKARQKVANELYCEDGMITKGKFHPKGGGEPQPLAKFETKIRPGGHLENFLAAVRSRKVEDLNADVLEAHYSSALCHLANISYRLGKVANFQAARETLGDNPVVRDTLKAIEANLAEGNGLAVDKLPLRIGPMLRFDAKTEKFVDNAAADELLTRPYRKPFVVPQTV